MSVKEFLEQCSNENDVLNLDKVVERWNVILSQDRLNPGFFVELMDHLQAVNTDVRVRFLQCVLHYHNLSRQKDPQRPAQWEEIGELFEMLEEAGPLVNCYKWIYAFLCYLNAEMFDRAGLLYFEAAAAAENLEETEKAEALGHLRYNYARHLLGQKQVNQALLLWKEAAVHRLHFLGLLNYRNADDETVLTAAQEVAKMRFDFLQFFPGEDIEECGISQATMQALLEEFEDKLSAFSAKK